jgi:hypothetical protein
MRKLLDDAMSVIAELYFWSSRTTLLESRERDGVKIIFGVLELECLINCHASDAFEIGLILSNGWA